MINTTLITGRISIYEPPISNLEKICTITLPNIYKIIKSDDLKKETENYRLGKGTKENDLPFALFSGSFNGRSKRDLIQHSNFIALDVNDIDDINELKTKLKKDRYVALLYTTPSNKGLRIVIIIDTEKGHHLEYFMCAQEYFKEKYDITIDSISRNVACAFYLCHDPDAYHDHNVRNFPLL